MTETDASWDLVVRSRKTSRYAIVVASCTVVAHVVAAILLRVSATGVHFRVSDQFGLAAIGVVIAGAMLLFTRPVVKVNRQGILVRNIFGYRFLDWDLVVAISFPDGKPWARIELPHDEYIAVMAIQSNDKDYAAHALAQVRSLCEQYQ